MKLNDTGQIRRCPRYDEEDINLKHHKTKFNLLPCTRIAVFVHAAVPDPDERVVFRIANAACFIQSVSAARLVVVHRIRSSSPGI